MLCCLQQWCATCILSFPDSRLDWSGMSTSPPSYWNCWNSAIKAGYSFRIGKKVWNSNLSFCSYPFYPLLFPQKICPSSSHIYILCHPYYWGGFFLVLEILGVNKGGWKINFSRKNYKGQLELWCLNAFEEGRYKNFGGSDSTFCPDFFYLRLCPICLWWRLSFYSCCLHFTALKKVIVLPL